MKRLACPKPLTPQGLLKKWKEDQCDFGGEGCEKMKLGSAGDMTLFGGHCKPAKEFRCDSEDKRGQKSFKQRVGVFCVQCPWEAKQHQLGKTAESWGSQGWEEAFTQPVPTWGQALASWALGSATIRGT